MKMKSLLSAGLGALALGLVATAAQAAPAGLAGAIDQSAGHSGLVEKATWYGDRYYGHYHRPYYGYRWYRHRHYGSATTAIAGTVTTTTGGIRATATATGNEESAAARARSGGRCEPMAKGQEDARR
jgi:hypothetical protein